MGIFHKETVWVPATRKQYVLKKFANTKNIQLSDDRGGLRLIVHAPDEEMAEELCSITRKEIYRLAEKAEEKGNQT